MKALLAILAALLFARSAISDRLAPPLLFDAGPFEPDNGPRNRETAEAEGTG